MSSKTINDSFSRALRRLSIINAGAAIFIVVLCVLGLIVLAAGFHWPPAAIVVVAILAAVVIFGWARLLVTTMRALPQNQPSAELSASEQRFRLIAENVTDLIVQCTPGGIATYVSPASRSLLGYEPEEMLGHSAYEFLHPEDAAAIQTTRSDLLTPTGTATLRNRTRRKDGSYLWVETTIRGLRDPQTGRIQELFTTTRDISEHHRADEQVRRLVSMQQAILDSANVSIISIDLKGIIQTFNAAAERWLGYSAQEMIGLQPCDMLHDPATLQRQGELFAWVSQGESWQGESEYVRKDGSRFPIELSLTALHDETGTITGLLAIASDVTRRKVIEQALRETINRYQALFEYANDLIYLVDAQTHELLEVNQNTVKQLGYSRDQLLHMTIEAINAPEQQATLTAIYDTLQSKRSAVYECVHIRQDGTPMPVEISSRLIEYGSREVIQNFARDMTERKLAEQNLRNSEARYRSVIEALSEGVVVYNNNAAMEAWNRSAERILGLTLTKSVEGEYRLLAPRWRAIQDDGSIFRGENYPAAVTLRTGQPQTNVVMGLKRSEDTDLIWLSVNSEPLFHPGETRPYGAVSSFIDITEARRVNGELARARDEAVEAAHAKTAFLATMSHELRTPMNGVIGMIDLLLETPLTEAQREMIEIIRTSGQTLLAIINDTLDYSKIEAGKMVLDRHDFEPLEIVENVADVLGPEARQKRLSLMTFVDPAIPHVLIGDSMRLHQILLNLVGNAVKFTESGEVAVQTDLEALAGEHATLYFSVSDTGIGISDDARQRLFAPFIQADDSMTRKYGGTGLGLAICKRLVELMGGEIGVESEPGQGSTFWFRVTLALPPAESPTRSGSIEMNALRGQKVLVVDDSPMARVILNRYLTDFGAVSAGLSGSAGVLTTLHEAEVVGEPFSAAIIDLIMPGMDGIDLGAAIKQDAALAHIPLILLSATPDMEQSRRALAAGFAVFLSKPVKQPELMDALLAALESSPPVRLRPQDGMSSPQAGGRAPAAWRILLVEDNLTNQRVLALQLGKLGYRPQMVDNGQQALDALATGAFDLVLMDCQMPDMDGFETTRRIRQAESDHAQHIPIIALTANALSGDREQCLAAGMDDYLSKPVHLKQLRQALTHWLPTIASDDALEVPLMEQETPITVEDTSPTTLDLKTLADLSTLGKGNPAVLGRLIDIFLENTPKSLAALRTALVQTDAGSLRLAAHSLKSSSASYGAMQLSELCKTLEAAARTNDWPAIDLQIHQVEAEYTQVKRALEAVRKEGLP